VGVTIAKSGSARVTTKGRVTTVKSPPMGSTLGLPVIVQLLDDDTCFAATFATATSNLPDALKAKKGQ
jgi:hypothetical protein